jgi:hypothetical protein
MSQATSEHKLRLNSIDKKAAKAERAKAHLIMPKGVRTKSVRATQVQTGSAGASSPAKTREPKEPSGYSRSDLLKVLLTCFILSLIVLSDFLPFFKSLFLGSDEDEL